MLGAWIALSSLMPPPNTPAIAVLSDHVLFRQVVEQRFIEQGFATVVQLPDRETLIAEARQRHIDVAIIDVDHDSEDLVTMVRELHRELPALQIILLATPLHQRPDDQVVLETEAVDRASAVTSMVGVRVREADNSAQWSRITVRQRDVMRWLALGLDNASIGQKLRIGERAVKAHVSSLLGLFGLANRTQLALLADRAGLRPPSRR
jgi:DNA-binding NarL/FixJ family response regulator